MMTGVGGEFDVTEERGHVSRIKRRRYFIWLNRVRLLDRVLQDGAAGIAGSCVIVGLGVELILGRLGELRRCRSELRLVGDLDLPLRRHRHAHCRGAEFAERWI